MKKGRVYYIARFDVIFVCTNRKKDGSVELDFGDQDVVSDFGYIKMSEVTLVGKL